MKVLGSRVDIDDEGKERTQHESRFSSLGDWRVLGYIGLLGLL